jgi:uncharacterized delta-60 repeat protein
MKFIIAIILFVSISEVNAQVTQEWVSRYNGLSNGSDNAASIAVDGTGNVYVTGSSSGGVTSNDYATVKYNSAGIEQWSAIYNGPTGNGFDAASSIAVDGSGNVYVTGTSFGSEGHHDYATIKYNSSGDSVWVRRYNGPPGNSGDEATSIAVDGFGNVYVSGSSPGIGTSNDYATIKYNSSGVEQWVSRYNGPGNSIDKVFSMALDGSGNVYVTGWSIGSGTADDYATIKYNSSGVEQWVSRYNGPGNSTDIAFSIAIDISGNVYVTGYSKGDGTSEDFATIKYNSSGIEQWVSRYNGLGNGLDVARSIGVDGSGNVYVTGYSTGAAGYGYATLKYNSAGVEQWVQRYNGPGNVFDWAYALAIDDSGNVYVTGGSAGIAFDRDYATIKYNSAGDSIWVQRYNGPQNNSDEANSIAVDGSGNVYVTGYSIVNGNNSDYITIKYSQLPSGVDQTTSDLPENYSLLQNYPNPFNPSTRIQYQVSSISKVSLKVYDILGNEVAILVNEEKPAGIYEVNFSADGLTSGIYFYKLQAGSLVETKKMIVLK